MTYNLPAKNTEKTPFSESQIMPLTDNEAQQKFQELGIPNQNRGQVVGRPSLCPTKNAKHAIGNASINICNWWLSFNCQA